MPRPVAVLAVLTLTAGLTAACSQGGDEVTVDIDEPSLATLQPLFGAWPWRRDVYALAVDRLRASAGASLPP